MCVRHNSLARTTLFLIANQHHLVLGKEKGIREEEGKKEGDSRGSKARKRDRKVEK